MTCSRIPHEITVTHRRRRRVVSALFESRGEQFCNSDERIKHSLVQSSISTPFLRQLELFSGRSISEVGIDNDINIRRIANSISNLEGVSDNFDPIVAEKFHNEGRRLFVESIDFDQGVLSVLEVRKIGRHQERTVKELWGKVIQETVASGVASTFEAMNQSILTNNGKEIAAGGVLSKQEIDLVLFSIATFNGDENDYHNEYILKEMRKIVHQLEGIEEQLSFLKAHLNDKGEDEIRRYVFDKTLKLTKLNKMFLKVLLKNEKPTSKSHVAELKNFLERMPDIKDKNRLLDVMTRIVSLYKAAEIQDLRKWLLANIPFELIVLLIDNSKSMDVENMLEAVVDWCKEYIDSMVNSPVLTAASVVTAGDGPKCLMPFTLLEDFNSNIFDTIKSHGCSPLIASIMFCNELLKDSFDTKLNSISGNSTDMTALKRCIVMLSDFKPTEVFDGEFHGSFCNSKDESAESERKNIKLIKDFVQTIIKVSENYPLVLIDTCKNEKIKLQQNQNGMKNVNFLRITELTGSSPKLAIFRLFKKYCEIKGDPGHAKDDDIRKKAEIYQQLDTEWIIEMASGNISLSNKDNDTLNHKAVRDMERFKESSTVVALTIKGKERNCRIVPIKEDNMKMTNEDGTVTIRQYKIKITFGDEVQTYILSRKLSFNSNIADHFNRLSMLENF